MKATDIGLAFRALLLAVLAVLAKGHWSAYAFLFLLGGHIGGVYLVKKDAYERWRRRERRREHLG